jgi:homoserine kinase
LSEPRRASFVPGFAEAKAAALAAGATGFAISGSGSSVFALAASRPIAADVAKAMCEAFSLLGHRAAPLVTTVENAVPLASIMEKSGPRFLVSG